MKSFRIPLIAFLCVGFIISSLRAQTGTHSSISRAEFQAVVKSLLAGQERGEYLYRHSESYHRLINFEARKRLGLISEKKNNGPNRILGADTSNVIDPTSTPTIRMKLPQQSTK